MEASVFKAKGAYQIRGVGTVWYGPSPFDFLRKDFLEAFAGKWRIDHPGAFGKVFRVTGVESHCVPRIRTGDQIGLVVVEIE